MKRKSDKKDIKITVIDVIRGTKRIFSQSSKNVSRLLCSLMITTFASNDSVDASSFFSLKKLEAYIFK